MCQWTTDSQRLILEHLDMICDSPSYIYHFALPISPSSSWLHQYYSAEFSQEIRVVKGVSAGWGTCLRTVSLGNRVEALTCQKDTIAAYLHPSSIIILNAITGIRMALLSGHRDWIRSLVFSPDGRSLVSGSDDTTIKLWDMQTGGVVKTFQGHTSWVLSVSLSPDCTAIASGSNDNTIRLWDVQTGECHHLIQQEDSVEHVSFFPLDPKHLMSASGGKLWQWDIGGQQIAPEYDGSCITFSSDGTLFAVCNGPVVAVHSSDSKKIMAKFHIAKESVWHCCFSPDNRFIAVAAHNFAYIWNITGSDPHLLDTFIGHTGDITSLTFSTPSSLISTSLDNSVKFWQIDTSSRDPVLANPKSVSLTSAPIRSMTLQAKDGIAVSSHSDGVVRIWDISTGICKASFQTPPKGSYQIDTHLTDGRLISVWYTDKKLRIWDTEKGELLRTVDTPENNIMDLRISGDGSRVFCLHDLSIQAWSIWTGEAAGRVEIMICQSKDSLLTIDGLNVWISFAQFVEVNMGWDFGLLDSVPVVPPDTSRNGPHLDFIGGIRTQRSFIPGVENTITRKVVFQLPGRLARCSDAQWDGQYLVVGYDSGEVLILECNHVLH